MFTDRAVSKEGISPTTTPSPRRMYGTHNTINDPYEIAEWSTRQSERVKYAQRVHDSSYKYVQQDNSAPNRARRAESSQGVPPHTLFASSSPHAQREQFSSRISNLQCRISKISHEWLNEIQGSWIILKPSIREVEFRQKPYCTSSTL